MNQPRIFEERKLVQIEGDRATIVFERAYEADDYSQLVPFVEWWGVATVTLNDGQRVAQVPCPFKINATSRAEAFANAEKSWRECEEGAVANIKRQMIGPKIVGATEMQAKQIAGRMLQ